MTKRTCPFDTSVCRQLKVHVNGLENDAKALKEIQDKTIKKLMDGSKKLNSLNSITRGNSAVEPSQKCNMKQNSLKQYLVGNGASEIKNGNANIGSYELINKCRFCDKETDSTYQCVSCCEYYCTSCSFPNYNSFEESIICMSCSS